MMDPESSVTGNKRCSLSFRPWVAMVPGCFTVSDGHVPFEMLGGTFDSETRVEAGWGAVGGGIGRCVHASAGTPSAPRTETHTHTHTHVTRSAPALFVMLNNCRSSRFLLPQTS